MKAESHRRLGEYLARHYLHDLPQECIRAFLLGCIQPDKNPATYLKGSFRAQWLRGHNYKNAVHFIRRISQRLETKNMWSLYDFYTLGKLIHYIADAFTYAHNEAFSSSLTDHRIYESDLQAFFLEYIRTDPSVDETFSENISDTIEARHKEYIQNAPNIYRDARCSLSACCCVLSILFLKPIIC